MQANGASAFANAEEIVEKKGGFVQAKREDVIEAGLIKEKIIFQTQEDLDRKEFKNMDQDDILLELAFQKRLDLIAHYKSLKLDINPLVVFENGLGCVAVDARAIVSG